MVLGFGIVRPRVLGEESRVGLLCVPLGVLSP